MSPAALVPESGETGSLSMAGFPGRWLGTSAFSPAVLRAPFGVEPAWGARGLLPGPPAPPPRREQRSQTWTGRGLPGAAVGNLWPGCCQVTFCFTSQVPAFCGRDDIRLPWPALQPAPTPARLPPCPGTAVPQPRGLVRPFQCQARGQSCPLCHLQSAPAHLSTQDCLQDQTALELLCSATSDSFSLLFKFGVAQARARAR